MSLHTTTRNRSLAWSNDGANISLIETETAAVCERGRWRGIRVGDGSQVSGEDVVDARRKDVYLVATCGG